jgi:hypothetical protein
VEFSRETDVLGAHGPLRRLSHGPAHGHVLHCQPRSG